MYQKDKDNIQDMLSNAETQYTGLDFAIEYVQSINPEISHDVIEKEYGQYMQYCINNDLI